jgi:hypothetical protein
VFEPGPCLRVHQGGVWNHEVQEYAYTREGLLIRLNERAVKTLQMNYKGTPMIVKYRGSGWHCVTPSGRSCDDLNCFISKSYGAYTKAIQFARQNDTHECDDSSSCLLNILTFGICQGINYCCCTQVEYIDFEDITPIRLTPEHLVHLNVQDFAHSTHFTHGGAGKLKNVASNEMVQEVGLSVLSG